MNDNLLVEASAGTGKTHSLTARMAEGIHSGAYRPQHMAAVTFTRKAAAELSSRLRRAVQADLEGLFIGTVHSFCARMLRQYPVAAGLAPGFRELDEAEDELLARKLLRERLHEPEGRKLLRLLAQAGANAADLADALRIVGDHGEVDYPAPPVVPPDLAPAWQRLDELADFLEAQVLDCDENEPTCKLLVATRTLLRRRGQAGRETPRDLVRLLGDWEGELKPVKKYWGAKRAEQDARLGPVLEAVAAFRTGVVEPFLTQWRAHLYGECMPFLLEVRRRTQLERQSQGLVNFNDLLRQCARLLRENADVRARLQDRVRHLFVDEFQDTDPLQAEIFLTLSGGRPDSLFLVGDPKQSIYRFRRADIETYLRVRETLPVHALETSYRSTPALCQWVNGVFRALLPERPTREQAAFAPLVPVRESVAEPPVYVLNVNAPYYYAVGEPEAELIANRIAAWVGDGTHRWRDFLVLTMRKADLLHTERALTQRGIPCVAGGDARPLDESEWELVRLLRVLANPQDKVALVGVLRGRHSDEELFTGSPAVDATIAQLREWGEMLREGASVEQLGWPGPVADYLGQLGEAGLTLSQALSELEEAGAVPVPSPRAGHPDVVRVMNLHKAKGLEARVVFLAAPTGGLPALATHTGDALCMVKYRKPWAHPADWSEREAQELAFLAAERHRLLYVAATRARETLVVSRWTGTHASALRPWQDLEPFLEGCPELPLAPPAPLALEVAEEADAVAPDLTPSWERTSVTANRERVAPLVPPEGGDGVAWGELIHRLLEQLVRRPELAREELAALARWFALETPELAEAAVDTVHAIREQPFWARVLAAHERLLEVPFGLRAGNRLLFGVIDVALRQEDGWDLVDYKTDARRLEDLVASYARQVQQYAESWRGLTDEEVGYAGLYSVREGRLSEDLAHPLRAEIGSSGPKSGSSPPAPP